MRGFTKSKKKPMLKILALYLIGKAEIPIHYTTWAEIEQALLWPFLWHVITNSESQYVFFTKDLLFSCKEAVKCLYLLEYIKGFLSMVSNWLMQFLNIFEFCPAKGQLILKCLFCVFNFSQNTNENKSTWGIIAVKSNFFLRFLGETEDIKNTFWN